MRQPPSVLIVSYTRAMQQLTEQLCRRAGSETVTVEPGKAADGIVTERGLGTFTLVVLDTDVPWEPPGHHPRMARGLLREWTALAPTLPFVLVGTQAQKHALLMIRADIVRFVAKPFEPHELSDAIKTFLPLPSPRRSSVTATLSQLPRPRESGLSPAAANVQDYGATTRLA